MMPVSMDVNRNFENSKEYTQVNVQYPYRVMSPDTYILLMGLQLHLSTCVGIVYYSENSHLL